MAEPSQIRIFLADDHAIVRQALSYILNHEKDMTVVGDAEDGRSTLEKVPESAPHVVIMDVCMPGLNGVEATRQILAKVKGVKVLVLTMYSDRHFVSDMLSAGATGYVLKDCDMHELVHAIRTVIKGEMYLSSRIAGIVAEGYTRYLAETDSPASPHLTSREKEVLQLLAEGWHDREVAEKLSISEKTVQTHRLSTMNKLDLRGIAELTKYAIRSGLTSLDN